MSTFGLAAARVIVAAALDTAHAEDLKPMAVIVLDAGGHLIAAEREDGASNKRFEIAHAKAYGAISLGMGSRALMSRAEQQAYFISGAASAIGGALVAVPGGVLVLDDGAVVGVVGASGDTSDNDEKVVIAGIAAAGLTAQPD
ncbi:hypothetical protein GCM10011575_33570 [Microlunatus endophyticus]|uniref:Glc operon protein GlcG n=1 Tax=Microlunatus endophyticus TaxID=1716077 RepID=A0A917W5X3_9ACTN|nr:heme-binding protein [Microlunatus endophyticus]GGL72597.1 hypothetical protein GCM10011575_33570 [Microlunatus endophyticus]